VDVLSLIRVLLHSQEQVPEHFPPLKVQTSPDLFLNTVVKIFGDKNEKFGTTFFCGQSLLLLKN